MVFFWRKGVFDMFKKMGEIVVLKTIFHNVYRRAFNHIQKADLVAFPVSADRVIERNFSGAFFAGTQHHKKFIVNAAGSVCGKLGSTAQIKSGNGFDKADGTNGDQVIRVFIATLIFFCNMGYQAQIVFDQNVFCFRIAPLEAEQIALLFISRQRFWESFQRFTSKGISI